MPHVAVHLETRLRHRIFRPTAHQSRLQLKMAIIARPKRSASRSLSYSLGLRNIGYVNHVYRRPNSTKDNAARFDIPSRVSINRHESSLQLVTATLIYT